MIMVIAWSAARQPRAVKEWPLPDYMSLQTRTQAQALGAPVGDQLLSCFC